MKKSLCILLYVILALITVPISANEPTILGLQEKMDALWLVNVSDQAMLDNMYQTRLNSFNAGWEQWLSDTKRYGKTGGKTDAELYDEQWSFANPKFDAGLQVSSIITNRYLEHYAQSNKISYLLSGTRYWSIYTNGSKYLLDGKYVGYENRDDLADWGTTPFIVSAEAMMFLKNPDMLETMLFERDELLIYNVELFAPAQGIPFLYIVGEQGEYLVRLGGTSGYIPQMESLKLYSASEMMALVPFIEGNTFTNNAKTIKSTFQTEAEFLQSAGLLNGNENGLDLLKPLSRIEAAAMLLRALGQSETANSGSGQIFSDVPQDHWGYGAAENAYNLGLIQGVGNDQFAPDKNVTATEFSTMVLRASGTPEFDWEQALNLLIEQNIITQDNANTMDFFTRGDMAKIIYEAKAKNLL